MRWRDKPPAGTPIDARHRLAQGMIGAWTINEGVGTRIANAALLGLYDMNPYTVGGSWVGGPNGWAYQLNNGFFTAGVIKSINGLSKITIFIRGKWASYFSSGRSGGSSLLNILGDQFGVVKASIGSNYGTATVGVLGECSLAMVFDGTGATNADRLKVYASGMPVSLAFTGTIPSTIPTDTTGEWYLGAQRFLSPDYNSRRDLDMLWGRALTAADVAAVHAMPWDIYLPPPGWSDADVVNLMPSLIWSPLAQPLCAIGPSLLTSPIIGA